MASPLPPESIRESYLYRELHLIIPNSLKNMVCLASLQPCGSCMNTPGSFRLPRSGDGGYTTSQCPSQCLPAARALPKPMPPRPGHWDPRGRAWGWGCRSSRHPSRSPRKCTWSPRANSNKRRSRCVSSDGDNPRS